MLVSQVDTPVVKNSSCTVTAYEGYECEDDISGWSNTSGVVSDEYSHTGDKSLKVISSDIYGVYAIDKVFSGSTLNQDGTYIFSTWVKVPSTSMTSQVNIDIRLNYTSGTYKYVGGKSYSGNSEWQLLRQMEVDLHKERGSNTINSIVAIARNSGLDSRTCYWDDMRFYPADALMQTFTYEPGTMNINSVTDENNNTKRFEYDGMGRLIKEYKTNSDVLIKAYNYHYSRE
jgi:hypothetical protein